MYLLHVRPALRPLGGRHVVLSPGADAGWPMPDLKTVLEPIAGDMLEVDAVIRTRLDSDVVLINTVADYIIGAGGKRLRPAVLLLVARALGYTGTAHVLLAAVIEFIHTATLLHDDVVDESDLRRGTFHRQCDVRQRRERAGRRLPVLPFLPDDGRRREHAQS